MTTQSSEPNLFFDLLAYVETIQNSSPHRTLKHKVHTAWRARSCVNDLLQAQSCCTVLKDRRSAGRCAITAEDNIIDKALLNTAVQLYVRATSTSGRATERGSIQISDKLTDEQRIDHSALIDLRNQSLSHVDITHSADGRTWHEVSVFAAHDGEKLHLATTVNETSFHGDTFDRLIRMLPVATEIVNYQANQKIEKVSEHITSPTFPFRELFGYPLDLSKFKNEAIFNAVMNGPKGGTNMIWHHD